MFKSPSAVHVCWAKSSLLMVNPFIWWLNRYCSSWILTFLLVETPCLSISVGQIPFFVGEHVILGWWSPIFARCFKSPFRNCRFKSKLPEPPLEVHKPWPSRSKHWLVERTWKKGLWNRDILAIKMLLGENLAGHVLDVTPKNYVPEDDNDDKHQLLLGHPKMVSFVLGHLGEME